MGRAIDMENDIGALKIKIEKLENTVRGMVSKLDELNEKSSKTKHVDLTEVKNEKKKEKTDNEGNGDSNKPANSPKSKSSKKNK
jgi:predicted  nucleic acid-binding Zn-ribbon protein